MDFRFLSRSTSTETENYYSGRLMATTVFRVWMDANRTEFPSFHRRLIGRIGLHYCSTGVTPQPGPWSFNTE